MKTGSSSDLVGPKPETLENVEASKHGTRTVLDSQDDKTISGTIYFRDHERVWYRRKFKIDKKNLRSM